MRFGELVAPFAADPDLDPLDDSGRGREDLDLEVDTIAHGHRRPGRANLQAIPSGWGISRLDAPPVSSEIDEARAIEGAIIASADRCDRSHRQECVVFGSGSFRPVETGMDLINLERPGPAFPAQEPPPIAPVRFEVRHEINSKTPPTRIATDRRGRNREEAGYKRGRYLGREESLHEKVRGRQNIGYFLRLDCQEILVNFFDLCEREGRGSYDGGYGRSTELLANSRVS